MQATFTGINISTRGLYASQLGLSVTAENTSNAKTTGYSRQTVTQTAVTPAASYGGNAIIGNGVEVTSIDQERDALLDQRYWTENTRLGEWETKSNTLTEIEEVMNNATTSTGFSTIFDKFYTALETLKTNPGDSSTRSEVQEYGEAVCDYLNDASTRLTEIKDDLNTSIKTTATQINSYADQIAALNQRISVVTATNGNSNTLTDQRNVLVDELTKLTGCTVTQNDDSSMTIQLGSATLVDGAKSNHLSVSQDSSTTYKLTWENTGETATITGGTLKAELDLRDSDGTNGTYKGVDYYVGQLDTFAQTFAKAFNEGVLASDTASGATTGTYKGMADGYTTTGTTGVRFFSYTDATGVVDIAGKMTTALNGGTVDEVTASSTVYANVTAANICLSSEVTSSVNNIAAASAANETENSTIVADLIDMCQDTDMFNKGTPGDFYNSIISTLATDSDAAQRRDESYSSVVKQIANRRTSVSGIDTNEETAYMTQYQEAYNASAQMVSTWNEVFAATIAMLDD